MSDLLYVNVSYVLYICECVSVLLYVYASYLCMYMTCCVCVYMTCCMCMFLACYVYVFDVLCVHGQEDEDGVGAWLSSAMTVYASGACVR